jgi:hypothetical protein
MISVLLLIKYEKQAKNKGLVHNQYFVFSFSTTMIKILTEKNKNTLTMYPRTPIEENKAHKNLKIKIRTYHFDAAASGGCLSWFWH